VISKGRGLGFVGYVGFGDVSLDFEEQCFPKLGVYGETYFTTVKDLEKYSGNVCYNRY